MKTYKIETPNKLYKGITEGVPFSKGIGFTDCKDTRNILVNDYKYKDVTDYSQHEEKAQEAGKTTAKSSEGAARAQEFLVDTGHETDLEALKVSDLKEIVKDMGLSNYSELKKEELIALIQEQEEQTEEQTEE